jgi:phenylpropionate dioxygenase-like ring-hydroxylating dioxygenase large terminal subunit
MRPFSAITQGHWFVAATSKAVTRRPLGVMMLGSPLLLARGSDGGLFALEDRCPHRGVALSGGRMESYGVVCPYHGWAFASDGRCTRMPGLPDGQPLSGVRVPHFSAQERDGLVWVSKTGAARPLPDRILALNPKRRRFLWQSIWAAPVLEAQENFLDALHTHSIHQGMLRGKRARHPVTVTLHSAGDGFQVDYRGQPTQSGLFFKLFESKRVSERAYFSGLSVAQLEYRYLSGWAAWITLYFTPQNEESTHIFGTLHVEGRFAPTWLIRSSVWPLMKRVARQDQTILEHQREQGQLFPGRQPMTTPMDIVRPFLEAAWLGRDPPEKGSVERTLDL